MSKGSAPRPFSVSNEEYAQRWDAIFRRDVPEEPPVKTYHNGKPVYVQPIEQTESEKGENA